MSEILDFFDDLGPEKVFFFHRPDSGLKAMLVIDGYGWGTFPFAAGGIRMAPDVTIEEVFRLARAMTFKFTSYDLTVTGAKAGIILDPNSPDRDKIIADFAFETKTLIKEDVYHPGPDMGTNDRDIERIFTLCDRVAMIPTPIGKYKFELPVEETFTGWGITQVASGLMKLNDEPEGLTGKKVAIEGFGKVGSSLSQFLTEVGAKIVAISTINGALYNDDGLDIKKLINLKKMHGDDLIEHYENADKLSKEELFKLPTDIVVPGARPDVINKENIDSIKARYIIPGANIPYDREIIPILNEMPFTAVPDFVANAGEIIFLGYNRQTQDPAELYALIARDINNHLSRISTTSKEKNISLYNAAMEYCLKVIKRDDRRRRKKREKIILKSGLYE